MILRKKDFVAQFELLTKQQIKEHADALLASNKAVNMLKNLIEDIRNEVIKKVNSLSLKVGENEKNLADNKVEYNRHLREYQSKNHDALDIINANIASIRTTCRQLIETKVDPMLIDLLETKVNDLEKKLTKLVEEKHFTASENIKKVYPQIDSTALELRKYIDDLSIETLEREFELKEKIRLLGIEKESYQKEIAVLKKNDTIQEKKIENLYTLIDRLKKEINK